MTDCLEPKRQRSEWDSLARRAALCARAAWLFFGIFLVTLFTSNTEVEGYKKALATAQAELAKERANKLKPATHQCWRSQTVLPDKEAQELFERQAHTIGLQAMEIRRLLSPEGRPKPAVYLTVECTHSEKGAGKTVEFIRQEVARRFPGLEIK